MKVRSRHIVYREWAQARLCRWMGLVRLWAQKQKQKWKEACERHSFVYFLRDFGTKEVLILSTPCLSYTLTTREPDKSINDRRFAVFRRGCRMISTKKRVALHMMESHSRPRSTG